MVEAVQWFGFEAGPHNLGVIPWSRDGMGWLSSVRNNTKGQCGHRIVSGDWIIKDARGEVHSCKQGIFEQIYESVE